MTFFPDPRHDWRARLPAAPALVESYQRDGYAIVRGLFSAAEIAAMAESFDRIAAEALRLGRSFRHGNLLYRLGHDERLGPIPRLAQWPSWRDGLLDRVRLDPRLCRLVAPLIGDTLKQIINQMHWKPPGAARVDFAYHQDCRFRRPAEAFRDLASSYVQTGIAIDPHRPASGGMRFLPGSHRLGDLGLGEEGPILHQAMQDDALVQAGLDPAAAVDVVLDPGDVALWSPYLVHGSGPNVTASDRRLYINGYVAAASCDRGEWAFRAGEPVPLGPEPALVHFDGLRERPEPHFVED